MAESHREEIAKLEALYASNPGGRVFVHLAEALRKAGDHERARGILAEGLARHADSASGYVVLGRLLTDLGDHPEAERAFRQVLELDAANLVALRGLADLSMGAGRYDEAARNYGELLSRNPFDEEIRHLLGQAESLGRAAAAAPAGAVEPQEIESAPRDWDEQPEPAAATEALAAPEAPDAGADALAADAGTDWDRIASGEAAAAGEFGETSAATAGAPSGDVPAQPSAAPGETGDAEPADPEFALIDFDALPGDLAAFAGATGTEDFAPAEPPREWDDLAADPDLSELFEIPADAAVLEARLEGGFEAEPLAFEELDVELELAREDSEPADLASIHEREDPTDAGIRELLEAGPEVPVEEGWPAIAGTGMAGWTGGAEPTWTEPPEPPGDEGAEPAGTAAPADEPGVVRSGRGAPPAAAELLGTAGRGGAVRSGSESGGLVTETMADLYMSQGHVERAAEVYRALLERRPGDESLLAKLEAAVQARRPHPAEPVVEAAEPVEESPDAWLRGVGAAWTAEEAGGSGTATPYAWTEAESTDAEPAGVVPIASYLQTLLGWRPEGTRAHEAGAADHVAGGSAEPWASAEIASAAPDEVLELEPEPVEEGQPGAWTADEPTAGEPWDGEPDPWAGRSEPDPWAAPAAGSLEPTEASEPADPWAAPAAAEADAEQGSEAAPWASGQYTGSEAAPDAPDAAAAGEPAATSDAAAAAQGTRRGLSPVEEAFHEWYGGAPPAENEAAAAAAPGEGGAAPERQAEVPDRTAEQEQEEEDLAMFRAWLNSLKK